MKRIFWIGMTVLALALCPVLGAGAEEQAQPEETAKAEETAEPTATPKPAAEKEVRAAFETYLREVRGLGTNVLKKSEFQLRYDEGQGVWLCTVTPDRDALTSAEKEWMKAYEGSPGIRWDRLTALYDREGQPLDGAALAAYEGVTPPAEDLITEEKAIELARMVTGLQYELKEKTLAALTATALLRTPKGGEDPAHYEYHIEFRDGVADEQGGIPWRYLAKVDAQTGQVLVVLEQGDLADYSMGK